MARNIFNLIFWGIVIFLCYLLWPKWPYVMKWLYDTGMGPFGQVVGYVGFFAILIGLNFMREAVINVFVAGKEKATGAKGVNLEKGNYARNLQKQAIRLARRRDYKAAGEVYETLGDFSNAAQNYQRAGDWLRAGSALEQLGEWGEAAELMERGGDLERAVELAKRGGQNERVKRYSRAAADKARSENRFLPAAAFYEEAGEFVEAGKIFETAGRAEEALRCYEVSEEIDGLKRVMESVDPARIAVLGGDKPDLLKRCAATLAKHGKKIEGARVLQSIGENLKAAELYEQAHAWEESGEAYFAADKSDKGAEVFQKSTNKLKVAEFMAKVAMKKGDWKSAGAFYEEAGKQNQAIDAFKRGKDYDGAARVYESMKRFIMAGEMYSSAKNYPAAARAYAQAPDWRNAAECYEKAEDWEQAREAYVNAGMFLNAGQIAFTRGDTAKAIDFFQRVAPNAPEHKLASAHLAQAFHVAGRRDMARDLFRRAYAEVPISRETLPIFYSYAKLLEEDHSPDAIVLYRQLMGVDANYEDVSQRAARLEREVTSAQQTGSSTQSGIMDIPRGGSFKDLFGTPPPQSGNSSLFAGGATGGVTSGGTGSGTTGFSIGSASTIGLWSATQSATNAPNESQGIDSVPGITPWKTSTQAPETRFGDDGRYRILAELGRSGVAVTYKAVDQHLDREVCIKTFPLSRHSGPGREEIFLNEARLVARLSHPNIVTIYDSGHMNYLYYIAMEFIEGEDMKNRVKRVGPMALREAKQGITQIAQALSYAHSHDVLHLDLRPGNVLMSTAGHVKVVDFGLAKILQTAATTLPAHEDSQLTMVGQPQYMAPEQILQQPLDPRTDVYSLGLTLFFLLTGRTPFEVRKITDPVEISRQQVQSSFPRPSTLNATLPASIDDIFVKCTQKSPGDRYPSIMDFLDDFSRV